MLIRDAKIEDIPKINEIHNQAIEEKFKVAYRTPWSDETMLLWFKDHNCQDYPICVLEADHIVCGYGYTNPYRPGRIALNQTAEISYFVDQNSRRRGVGQKLIAFIEAQSVSLGIKNLFATIFDVNFESVRLIEKCGFKKIGHFPKAAAFDDIEVGHFYFAKRIS
jgi:phosphinothricin acetyltransferase